MKYLPGLVCTLLATACFGDWNHDFDDGTLQGLMVRDLSGGFDITPVDGSLRFQSAGGGGDDDTAFAFDPEILADTSALVLIRYSTNPNLGPPGTYMNGGLIVRGGPWTVDGYVLVMNDSGCLQMLKVHAGVLTYLCFEKWLQDVPDFTHTLDWWMRFEAITSNGVVYLRGRVWPDGTTEPCGWQITCSDADSPFFSGVVALVANEDDNGYFLDLDNASASSTLTCPETCDNGIDDNEDGLVDCLDPQCKDAPACRCHIPFADLDGDGDVDQVDFGIFQACFSGSGLRTSEHDCHCVDRDDVNANGQYEYALDGNGSVDLVDFACFMACYSGPAILADANCGP